MKKQSFYVPIEQRLREAKQIAIFWRNEQVYFREEPGTPADKGKGAESPKNDYCSGRQLLVEQVLSWKAIRVLSSNASACVSSLPLSPSVFIDLSSHSVTAARFSPLLVKGESNPLSLDRCSRSPSCSAFLFPPKIQRRIRFLLGMIETCRKPPYLLRNY